MIERRLLTAEERGGVQRIELTHDLLVPLVAKSRTQSEERLRDERARAEAEAATREQRRARTHAVTRITAALLGILALTATVLGWLAYTNARLARSAQAEAAALVEQAGVRAFGRAREALANDEPARHLAYLAESLGYSDHAKQWAANAILTAPSHPLRARIPSAQPIRFARFTQGNTLVVGTENTVRIWDPKTGKPLGPALHPPAGSSVVLLDDGSHFVQFQPKADTFEVVNGVDGTVTPRKLAAGVIDSIVKTGDDALLVLSSDSAVKRISRWPVDAGSPETMHEFADSDVLRPFQTLKDVRIALLRPAERQWRIYDERLDVMAEGKAEYDGSLWNDLSITSTADGSCIKTQAFTLQGDCRVDVAETSRWEMDVFGAALGGLGVVRMNRGYPEPESESLPVAPIEVSAPILPTLPVDFIAQVPLARIIQSDVRSVLFEMLPLQEFPASRVAYYHNASVADVQLLNRQPLVATVTNAGVSIWSHRYLGDMQDRDASFNALPLENVIYSSGPWLISIDLGQGRTVSSCSKNSSIRLLEKDGRLYLQRESGVEVDIGEERVAQLSEDCTKFLSVNERGAEIVAVDTLRVLDVDEGARLQNHQLPAMLVTFTPTKSGRGVLFYIRSREDFSSQMRFVLDDDAHMLLPWSDEYLIALGDQYAPIAIVRTDAGKVIPVNGIGAVAVGLGAEEFYLLKRDRIEAWSLASGQLKYQEPVQGGEKMHVLPDRALLVRNGVQFEFREGQLLEMGPAGPSYRKDAFSTTELADTNPALLALALKGLAGMEITEQGTVRLLEQPRESLAASLQCAGAGCLPPRLAKVVNWHLADPDQRGISPDSSETARAYVDRILSGAELPQDPWTLYLADPMHPLVLFLLWDRAEGDPEETRDEARRLRLDIAFQRLARSPRYATQAARLLQLRDQRAPAGRAAEIAIQQNPSDALAREISAWSKEVDQMQFKFGTQF